MNRLMNELRTAMDGRGRVMNGRLEGLKIAMIMNDSKSWSSWKGKIGGIALLQCPLSRSF